MYYMNYMNNNMNINYMNINYMNNNMNYIFYPRTDEINYKEPDNIKLKKKFLNHLQV